jgi:hypothetical protein
MARAYRRFAVAEPAFFSVMFGPVIPGFTPGRTTRELSRERSFGRVVTAAQECLDAGTLRAPGALPLAQACWTATHGVAALRHAGLLEDDADEFGDSLVRTVVDAHRP